MAEFKIRYFDFPGGRGEDCRLALWLGKADFEDDRIPGKTWPEVKPTTPFGAMPVLEVEGKGAVGQSNPILRYLGRRFDMHPADEFEAMRHEAIMEACEDLRAKLTPSGSIKDEEEKKKVREELAAGYIATWGANVEAQIEGPFVAGDKLNVVDLKLRSVVKWMTGGILDHVPTDVFKDCPKLLAVRESVESDERVQAWYARG